jgi:hypothetical protein
VRVKKDTSGRAAIAAMPSALSCVGVERVIAPTISNWLEGRRRNRDRKIAVRSRGIETMEIEMSIGAYCVFSKPSMIVYISTELIVF